MRVVFILPGTEGRPKILNGDTIRFGGAPASGTDQSVILVAEYLAKHGCDVTVVLEKTDEKPCRGVKYCNFNYMGLIGADVDVLITCLWFGDYNTIPFNVKHSLIYWYHLAWVYGINEIINFVNERKISLGFVNVSKWAEGHNTWSIELGKNKVGNAFNTIIPNPIMTDLMEEITQENVVRHEKSAIFHAQFGRGGGVAQRVVNELGWERPLKTFDYVDRHGGVDKDTLFRELVQNDYFIFPLYHPNGCVYKDTFSCAVAEAMAAGLIVVTYPLGALPEYFSEGCVFVDFPPGTDMEKMGSEKVTCEANYMDYTENIKEKINHIEANPEIKKKVQENGLNIIKSNFSIDVVGKMWVDLIEEAVQDSIWRKNIDGSFFINIKDRKDRYDRFLGEIEKQKIRSEWSEGVVLSDEELEQIGGFRWDGEESWRNKLIKPQFGCATSHLNVVREAKNRGLKNVLIFEDDCVFEQGYNVKEIVNALFEEIEENNISWDMIFLGANNLGEFRLITPHLAKMSAGYCAHAYIVNSTIYDKILEYSFNRFFAIDVFYSGLMGSHNVFCSVPLLTTQGGSYSDIEQRTVDYQNLIRENFEHNMKKMDVGFFYQAGHMDNNILSTYMALKQLRKIYPTNPIAFFEDESDNLKPIAKKFKCDYEKIPVVERYTAKRMPVVDLTSGLEWLKRIYDACNTTLKNCEWVMHFEDDVWLQRKIDTFPEHDFGGGHGHAYSDNLFDYLKTINEKTPRNFGMCGGSVFRRDSFLLAYSKINEINWDQITELDHRMTRYSDAILSFVMSHAGCEYDVWNQWGQHNVGKIHTAESVLHNVKYFYNHKSIEKLGEIFREKDTHNFLTHHNGLHHVDSESKLINVGLFYQSGGRKEACFYALKSFRKHFPTEPVALYEDNGDILLPVAQHFNCDYKKTDVLGKNEHNRGRPCYDLETTLAWAKRVYEACTTTLKDVDWVIHFEDDVLVTNHITHPPKYDISGIPGHSHNEGIYQYLKKKTNTTDDSRRNVHPSGTLGRIVGCGGSIFNRKKYIEAYENLTNTINWDEVLKIDDTIVLWSDAFLAFMFQYSNFTLGEWEDSSQCALKPMDDVSERNRWVDVVDMQKPSAFIHCYKLYYFPTEEETNQMEIELNQSRVVPTKTSVSDYFEYRNVCLSAANSVTLFNEFKRNKEYRKILEHVHYELGVRYMDFINNSGLFDFNKLDGIKRNDLLGSPLTEKFAEPFNEMSPTTLRYVANLIEMTQLFGDLNDFNIVEIGGGYGGLCFVINEYYKPKSYTIIDLHEPIELCKKYLHGLGVKNINYHTYSEMLPTKKYDLVISNYAFSECDKNVQLNYIEKILKHSDRGFMVYNGISHHWGVNSISEKELLQVFPMVSTMESGGSRLFYWKNT